MKESLWILKNSTNEESGYVWAWVSFILLFLAIPANWHKMAVEHMLNLLMVSMFDYIQHWINQQWFRLSPFTRCWLAQQIHRRRHYFKNPTSSKSNQNVNANMTAHNSIPVDIRISLRNGWFPRTMHISFILIISNLGTLAWSLKHTVLALHGWQLRQSIQGISI